MKYFQETTEWSGGQTAINHTYYLSDDKSKMVGYIRHGTTELFRFKSPIAIFTKGRKFKVVKEGEADSAYFGAKVAAVPDAGAIEVSGKDGKIYYLTKRGDSYSCTCSGFSFRGKCRHVDNIKEKVHE